MKKALLQKLLLNNRLDYSFDAADVNGAILYECRRRPVDADLQILLPI